MSNTAADSISTPQPATVKPAYVDKPTLTVAKELQRAYDHFNEVLFEGKLPPCLMTLQRKNARVYGYYSPRRFSKSSGFKVDEIAMNPMHFSPNNVEECLSTLVHEMVHQWQEVFGEKKARGRYHNKEWGTKMKEVGLYPSNTGQPGGKETGDQMTHYIMDDGRFKAECKKLLDGGYRLTWAEVMLQAPAQAAPTGDDGTSLPDKSNRYKYHCVGCGLNVWGKPDIAIVCGKCRQDMTRAD